MLKRKMRIEYYYRRKMNYFAIQISAVNEIILLQFLSTVLNLSANIFCMKLLQIYDVVKFKLCGSHGFMLQICNGITFQIACLK